MKYKFIILVFFLSLVCTLNYVSAKNKNFQLISKVIYIDPGHGGPDSGAYYKNIREADVNLEISNNLAKKLKKEGAIVYLTREGDYDLSVNNTINRKRSDLSRRANIINNSGCDLFLSIHLNAEETGLYKGAQVYYDKKNDNNKKFAKILQQQLKEDLNTVREYKENNTKYMQRRVNRTGVLLEVGFLSNYSERYLLLNENYQNKVTNSITKAIIKYFKK